MEIRPHWKKIWLSLNGESPYITPKDVKTILDITGENLLEGITFYKSHSPELYLKWKSSTVKETNDVVETFIKSISLNFNINADAAWIMFCNYLMYEYYGKFEDINDNFRSEIFCQGLLNSVWKFYNSERMFLIKILRYIIEKSKTDSVYKNEFTKFIDEKTVTVIRSCLLRQLDFLIQERTECSTEKYLFYDEWFDRNYREQLEIMITILTTSYCEKFSDNDLKSLFGLFQRQNIGDTNLKEKNVSENFTTLGSIKCVQNAMIVVAVQEWWSDKKLWLHLGDYMKEMISYVYQDTDYANINLIYSVLLVILQNSTSSHGWKMEEYQKYLEFAIENKAFRILYYILSNPVLQSPLVLQQLRQACCCYMEVVCFYFNTDDLIYTEDASVLVLCELLKERYIVDSIIGEKLPALKTLYKCAVRMFPFDFEPLTQISKAIATHSDYVKKVIHDLENLGGFTEIYSTKKTEVETHILSNEYRPFDNDTLIIDNGTPVIIWKGLQRSYVTFKVKYSYFVILQRLLDIFVRSIEQQSSINLELLDKILLGFALFKDLAQYDLKSTIENFNIEGCLMYINQLIINSWKPVYDDPHVVKLCFKLCLVVMEYKSKDTIDFLIERNYLPKPAFKSNSLIDLLTSNLYQEAKVTKAISKGNFSSDVIEIVELYVDFVQLILNTKYSERIQATGLVFVLLHIYPKLTATNFEGNWKFLQVINKCLKLLIFILEENLKPRKEKNSIYDKLVQVMVESDTILKSIVRIFAVSNAAVQEEMEKETNWENGQSVIYLACIKNSLIATKLFLTSLNVNCEENQQSAVTRKMCQIQYQKNNIVKILSTYLNYSFDIIVPKIVCRIIHCLAQNGKLLVYAMLEADHHQVNAMFLDRLRDPLYDEDTKVAIVELVATCVESQFGMTAAFFNIFDVQKQNKTKPRPHMYGENIANFMIEYLNNIKNSLEYLNNPLQNAILHLFYKLWMNKKSYLISSITQKEEFWSLLIDPLFHDFKFNAETYMKIFAIITVELYSWRSAIEKNRDVKETTSDMSISTVYSDEFRKFEEPVSESEDDVLSKLKAKENLKKEILKLLTYKNGYVEKWIKFMQSRMESKVKLDYDVDALCLLRAWKNFLIMTKKIIPDVLNEQPKTIELTKTNCLNGLLHYLTNNPTEPRILNDYTELLLLMVSHYSFSSESNIHHDFEKLINILGCLTNYYADIKRPVKESILTIVCHIIEQHSSFFVTNPTNTAKLLDIFCRLFTSEYEYLMVDLTSKPNKEIQHVEVSYEKHIAWNLLLSIINRFLNLKNIDQHLYYFKNFQILPSLLKSIEYFVNDCNLLKLAKVTVKCLVNYAKSPLAEHFLMFDLNDFYESVRPPKQYISIAIKPSTDDVPWYLKEFWIIYAFLLNLFHILQVKFGFLMLEYSLSFMHLYDDILKYLAGLMKLTTDTTALQLTCSCLKFFEAIFQFKGKWWFQNQQSFNSILNSIKETLNISVGIILRPNILVFKAEGNQYLKLNKIETVPEYELIKLVDMHIQIISWCLRCLLRCSPDLIEILHPIKTGRIFFDLVEHDYRVPKLILENPQTLNYGTLLCTMHFLCKTLIQIAQHSNHCVILRKKRVARFKGFNILGSDSETCLTDFRREDRDDNIETRDAYFGRDASELFLSPEALHATQRFVTSGVCGMSVPWLVSLDSKLVAYTLEILTTFLAQQIFISLQDPSTLDRQQLQFIKRELCSELGFFHEFIRNRVAYLYDYTVQGSHVFRSFAGKSWNEIEKIMPDLYPAHSKYWGVQKMEPVDTISVYSKLMVEDTQKSINNAPFLVEEDYLLFISHWFINMCLLTH